MNTVKRTPNSDISEIIAKLKYISSDINQDLEVKFKGYTHGQQGFIIQLNYVENINHLLQISTDIWTNIRKYLIPI